MVMARNCFQLFILSLWIPFLFSGCVPLAAVGAAAGAGAGTYMYINGDLKTDYHATLDDVWKACEKTIAGMRGTDVVPEKEIARGIITATINDERVRFEITYKARNLTTVAIRAGLIGNRLSSQLLHDRIADSLVK
jgi:hypothetical protein